MTHVATRHFSAISSIFYRFCHTSKTLSAHINVKVNVNVKNFNSGFSRVWRVCGVQFL